jgi:hypothetical protein
MDFYFLAFQTSGTKRREGNWAETCSLWSLDLFCCESMMLRTHWVLVVMDHSTRASSGLESMSVW